MVINLKNAIISRRLDHTGPERLDKVPDNVFVIDCDDFYNTLDNPKRHWYILVGYRDEYKNQYPVLHHMLAAMRTGRVDANPESRLMTLPIDYAI